MAVINVSCPQCAMGYKLDEVHRGKKATCKKCSTRFVIGGASTSRPEASSATPAPAAPSPKEAEAAKERPRGADGIPLTWEPGDDILGQYEVRKFSDKKPFIEGGMGRVNRVWHKSWQRDLVVKNIKPPKPPAVLSPSAVENFLREAEVWVDKLGLHPNIVSCHYVRVLGGLPRVFVEFVDGGDLVAWIESGKLYEGGTSSALERILDIAIQFTWGLHYTHEQGLVHQDVKPRNVMMTTDGIAKVTDFGLARARAVADLGAEEATLRPDVTGRAGTGSYQSREQAAGERLTPATDIWSWGVSVWHMFLGEVERGAGSDALKNLNEFVVDPDKDARCPEMPPRLVELLRSCFQPRPEDRPRSMLEVADTLQSIYQEVTGQPHPREQPKPDDLLADSFNNRAVSLFDLGKNVEAEQKWQKALDVDPHHPETTYNWGLIQWRAARMTDEQLLRNLREVAASTEDPARVDYLVGLVHLERNDCEAAIQVLGKAKGADADRVEIASALALAQAHIADSARLLRSFEGHRDLTQTTAFSPDGRLGLSGSIDGALRLWEVSSGRCLRSFEGHTDSVYSVCFSPDSRLALSSSHDETMRLWEVSSGRCRRVFEGHTNGAVSVTFSPDGRFALSDSDDETMRLWEVSTGRCRRSFKGHTGRVRSVCFSPDGRFALSGSEDKTLRLWEILSGRCLRSFEGHTERVTSEAFSPDGRFALSGSDDATMRLWEVSTGHCLRFFKGHTGAVDSVAFNPDGRLALSGSWDKTLRLWEVSSGRCRCTFEVHTDSFSTVAISAGGRLALTGDGRTLRLETVALTWLTTPLATSRPAATDHTEYHCLLAQAHQALARGETATAVSFFERARKQPGCARRTDTRQLGQELSRFVANRAFAGGWEKQAFIGHTGAVNSVAFSPDARFALSGSEDKTLRLWEIPSGRCPRSFEGHTSGVESVCFSPDGRFALSGGEDRTLRLWEILSGRCLRSFEGHREWGTSVAFSPDGRFALSGSNMWEVSSGRCLRSFEETSAAFSPDGRFALSGGRNNPVRLWELSSGRCLRSFEGHTEGVTSMTFNPDGRFALSGSEDRMLRLWEIPSGRCLRSFEGHTERVTSVAFSPDGRFALSGGWDETLRLWEIPSGRCLRSFEGHTSGVKSVCFSLDGRLALSGSHDRTLRLWELDWELERNELSDWNEGVRSYLELFLSLHTPHAGTLPAERNPTKKEIALALTRSGKPLWTEEDFQRLLERLRYAGYGWLRPEGVCRELENMAQTFNGPPLILGKPRGWLNWLFGR